MAERATLTQILYDNYLKYGDKIVAVRKKIYGIWNEYTWKDYFERVKHFSSGLLSLGFEPGSVVAIVGDTDPEWFIAELAAQAAGGISVGLYSDSLPDELKYIIVHSGASFVISKDQEQTDKIILIKDEIPQLKRIIYWEDKGLWNYDEPLLMGFDQVEELGREFDNSHPGVFEDNIQKGKADDIAILSYTSGTTGLPKGVTITHKNLLSWGRVLKKWLPSLRHSEYIAYLTPAWIWEQWVGLAIGLDFPLKVNFPEEPETIEHDVREIGPEFLTLSPRQWESLTRLVQVKIGDTSWWKRFLYYLSLNIGYRVTRCVEEGEKPTWYWKILFSLANLVMLGPLRDKLGISKASYIVTGSASLSPGVFRFFHAIGAPLHTIYGGTEASIVTQVRPGEISFNTVGNVIPGVEIRISNEGEILVKGDCVFQGYFKDPEATTRRLVNGWFHTGDAGSFDPDGRLVFWDRLDELVELRGGQRFAPQYTETALRLSPYIKDAFVVGDRNKDYATTVINIEFANVAKWAEDRNLTFTTLVDLSQKEETRELIKGAVEAVNQILPEFARTRKFVNLNKDFDADEAELTRTKKLRRTVMLEHYRGLIQAMYENKQTYRMSSPVTYRDGRKGTVTTDIHINNL